MITQETIQQILSRIDIIDIVGSFVKLKKRGANYLGLCPFHNEKSPSFTVSPTKEIYKCFGCGKSGNSIGFLMELEKYSYVEALRWLANKYNVEIQETEVSPEVKLTQQTADSLYIINNFAQQFFANALFNTEEGTDIAMSYLKERGFREDIIKKFQIGYNPSGRETFANAAIGAKYNIELLQKSGLVVVRDDRPMDNYRGRIIFPIHNQSGKVLGFGARVIKTNDRAPKYINTPENEIYVKSKILYGSYFARMAIDKADECLLVEGYTDVVSLHQAGVENVVASGGTSLTPDQLRLVKKYTNNLTIIYDGDGAGVKAALRGMDLALEEGLNVKLVLIPDKEDPDSYVNKIGAQAFRDFVQQNKKDFILFQLEVSLKDAGSDSTKKAQIVNQIAETISKINRPGDFTIRADYIRKVSELLHIEEAGLINLVNNAIRADIEKIENRNSKDRLSKVEVPEPVQDDFSNETYSVLFQDELQEKEVVKVLVNYGGRPWEEPFKTVAEYIYSEKWEREIFDNQTVFDFLELYQSIHFHSGKYPSVNDFIYSRDNAIANLIIQITNHPYELSKKFLEQIRQENLRNKVSDLSTEDLFKQLMENEEDPDNIVYDLTQNYENEVDSAMIYLKLRKIKRLILQNEDDLKENNTYVKFQELLDAHNFLKKLQMDLGAKIGNVIFPF